jgi:hypothetical protein
MYRVSFVYAPIPSKYFKTEKEAVAYQNIHVAATYLEKKTFFGKWKKVQNKA